MHFAFQISSWNGLLSNDAPHRRIVIFAYRCQITIHEHRFIPLLTGTLGSGRLSGKEKPACSIVGSVTCSFVIYMRLYTRMHSTHLHNICIQYTCIYNMYIWNGCLFKKMLIVLNTCGSSVETGVGLKQQYNFMQCITINVLQSKSKSNNNLSKEDSREQSWKETKKRLNELRIDIEFTNNEIQRKLNQRNQMKLPIFATRSGRKASLHGILCAGALLAPNAIAEVLESFF